MNLHWRNRIQWMLGRSEVDLRFEATLGGEVVPGRASRGKSVLVG